MDVGAFRIGLSQMRRRCGWAEEKLLAVALAAERVLGTTAERLGVPPMLATG